MDARYACVGVGDAWFSLRARSMITSNNVGIYPYIYRGNDIPLGNGAGRISSLKARVGESRLA